MLLCAINVASRAREHGSIAICKCQSLLGNPRLRSGETPEISRRDMWELHWFCLLMLIFCNYMLDEHSFGKAMNSHFFGYPKYLSIYMVDT
jgi:hypothetical protein